MRTLFAVVTALAFVLQPWKAHGAEGESLGGMALREGSIYGPSEKLLIPASTNPVVAMTVSPNGRYVVYVRTPSGGATGHEQQTSMWIYDRRAGGQKQVGRNLGHPCCELAIDPADPSRVLGSFKRVNGALWSTSRQVLVRFAGDVHILSMDGSLHGDV